MMNFNDNLSSADRVYNNDQLNKVNPTLNAAGKMSAAESNASLSSKKTGDHINGTIPGSTNPYAANPQQPSNFDQQYGNFSDINLNNLVLPYENVLFKYHQSTWNFSLYTMSERDYKDVFLIDPDRPITKHIIAQSGVTGRYSINAVQMTTAGPATPGQTTNHTINTCTMDIVEQGGMSLASELVTLSNELGYNKFMDVPLIMELDFVGQEQDTGAPMHIPGLNRKWGMRINNITASASQSGGTMNYKISMTSTHGGPIANKDWLLKEPFACTVSTFGEFVDAICDKLNEMSEAQYGYLKLIIGEIANDKFFEMELPQDLRDMPINFDQKQSAEIGKTKSGSDGAKNFSWSANTSFSRAVDDVLDCCAPIISPDGKSQDSPRQFVNIVPITTYVGYDPFRKTSVYKNNFYFLKFNIGDVTRKEDLEPEQFNLEYFLKHAETIDSEDGPKLNIKRYDYQFSGLNNEIIDLQLKFDQAFQIAIMRNPSSQVLQTNTSGTHQAELLEFGGNVYNTRSSDDMQELWKVRSARLKEAQDSGVPLTDEEEQEIRDAEGAVSEQLNRTQSLSMEGDDDEVPAYVYMEDYRENVDLTITGTNGIGKTRNNNIHSIPMEPENIATNTSASLRDNSTSVEMERRLIRDNYYNRNFLGSLNMKVVGDPYWLGWGDYSYADYVKRAAAGNPLEITDDDIHFANFLTTEAYILLNLKPIASISDETGILEIHNSSVFAQSIYRINKVTSNFNSDGTFTQTLTGGLNIRSLRRKDSYMDNTESDYE